MRNDAEPPICYNCKRRRPSETDPFVCEAFPAGIPAKIIDNRADHREAFPGDNGLRYDAIADDWTLPEFGPGPADGIA